MTLCNIHLHESAEHKGGEFTTYAGDGHGSGFSYDGTLTPEELPPSRPRSATARMAIWRRATPSRRISSTRPPRPSPAPPCKAALPKATHNPQLRVEAVIGVLVNDPEADDFTQDAPGSSLDGLNQLPDLPADLGAPTVYNGSTTGEDFDLKGSPVQVTWSVRPKGEDRHRLARPLVCGQSLPGKPRPSRAQPGHRSRPAVTDRMIFQGRCTI